jgi:NAD-dependent dihydropyrimidine dehydrogenase PreA subunit
LTYVITEGCTRTKDQSCVTGRLGDRVQERESTLVIDPDECGACEPERPVVIISPVDSLLVRVVRFTEVNAASAEGRGAAVERTLADRRAAA